MEIKIVITFKNEKAIIGVQSPGSDPIFEMATGDLPTVIGRVNQVVTAAQAKWAIAPKNPNIDIPKPAVTEKETAPAKSGAKPVPTNNLQNQMF